MKRDEMRRRSLRALLIGMGVDPEEADNAASELIEEMDGGTMSKKSRGSSPVEGSRSRTESPTPNE